MSTNYNYFDILGLDEKFSQDMTFVNQQLIQRQASVHPDNLINASAQEKRLMMEYSASLNEAFVVMKDPVLRACHVLELHGIVLSNETTLALSEDFFKEQMELRESLEEAEGDLKALKTMQFKIERIYQMLLRDISRLLDNPQADNLVLARDKVLHFQFYHKMAQEVEKAISASNQSTAT